MWKLIKRILIFVFICVIFQSLIKNSKNANKNSEIRYEDIKNSSWMENWRRSEEYQMVYSNIKERAKVLWPHDYEKRQREISNFMSNYEEEIFDNCQKKTETTSQKPKKSTSIPLEKRKKFTYSNDMGIPKELFEEIVDFYNKVLENGDIFNNINKYNEFVEGYVEKEIEKFKSYFKYVESNRHCSGIPIESYNQIVKNSLGKFVDRSSPEKFLRDEIQAYKDIYINSPPLDVPGYVYREIVRNAHQLYGDGCYRAQKQQIEQQILRYNNRQSSSP